MIDREKVINGVEHCINPVSCKGCPYRGKGECVRLLMEDALELLKAQEPREMTPEDARANFEKYGIPKYYLYSCGGREGKT